MRKLRHKDRKQLAQDHMGFETQMCLTPDPGVGMESWFFFCCDPNFVTRCTREIHPHLNSDDALILLEVAPKIHAQRLGPVLTRKRSRFVLSCSFSFCSVEGRLVVPSFLLEPWN